MRLFETSTNRSAGQWPRAVPFLVVSLLVHGLLFLSSPAVITIAPPTGEGVTLLAIEVVGQKPDAGESVERLPAPVTATPRQKQALKNAPVAQLSSQQRVPEAVIARTVSTPEAETSAAESATLKTTPAPATTNRGVEQSVANDVSDNRNRVLALLHDQLNRAFYYPRLAERRGWQGEVLLHFRLSRRGAIESVQVARSSGYPLLDQSAHDILSGLGTLPLQGLVIADMELNFPVIYRLNGG